MALKEDQASTRERERQAIALRTVGKMTYREIADRVGYKTADGAQKAIIRALQRDISQEVEQLRREELATLELAQRSLMSKVLQGDEKAIDQLLRIMASRRKYIGGLEVPTELKVEEVTDPAKELVAYLQGAADELERSREKT